MKEAWARIPMRVKVITIIVIVIAVTIAVFFYVKGKRKGAASIPGAGQYVPGDPTTNYLYNVKPTVDAIYQGFSFIDGDETIEALDTLAGMKDSDVRRAAAFWDSKYMGTTGLTMRGWLEKWVSVFPFTVTAISGRMKPAIGKLKKLGL